MRIEVLTCDGCGADLNDSPRWTAYDTGMTDAIDACSEECVVRVLASACGLCGVILAPGERAAQIHATWHDEEQGR